MTRPAAPHDPGGGGEGRGAAVEHLDLPIGGMTCAACAMRVEKRLNRIEGVEATVNYATERASVAFDADRVGGDDLVEAVRSIGYEAELPSPADAAASGGDPAREEAARVAALRRLLVSAALSVPVIALSMVPALQFDAWQWVALALATPVVLWGAWPFHRAAWLNLRHGAATMDTLVSIGTLSAWAWSVVAMAFLGAGHADMRMGFDLTLRSAGDGAHIYLEVAAGVTTFLLAGRYFEARAKRRAGSALRSLLEMGAKEATVLAADGTEVKVPAGRLAVGDLIVVRPGERIATDGVVEEGRSAVDMSLLTGESVPVEVEPGAAVAGGTVNAGGRLVVRATRVGEQTAVARIGRLVEEAQSGKAPVQRLADRVSAVFVPAVILLAAGTLAYWLATGAGATAAFTAAVAVLIVACPCALGLATPTALLVGTGRGAQIGVLIRGPEVLESTRRVDTILLDKTGTVTSGRMELVDLVTDEGTTRREALRMAGALEQGSEHPVAAAVVVTATRELGAPPAPPRGFVNHPGLGAEGAVDGRMVVAGRRELVEERGLSVPEPMAAALSHMQAAGRTAVMVAWDGRARAVLGVADAPRPTSAGAVERLRGLGLHPVLLTGDGEVTARAVAGQVGIDEVIAGVLPADKAAVVARLRDRGRVVAMVGDGVNDAPALAAADLGLAMGTGTDVAIEASDITLVSGDLHGAADAISLARRTLATIKGNLFWAFAYNVAALPLAAAGYLDPIIAGLAMALSSVFVVTNSLRLRRFRPPRGAAPPEGRR